MAINVKKALHKAQTLIKRGDAAAAAQLYRDILEQYPQNRQAINGLASLNKSDKIMRSSAPAPSRDQMSQLIALYQTNQLEKAVARGEQLAARFPDDPLIHNFLGVVALNMKELPAATTWLGRAIQLYPDYAEALCNLGIVLQQAGRYRDAADHFSKAASLEPENFNAHYGLGSVQRKLGLRREAVASYRKVVELQPDNWAAQNNLGNALQKLGRYDEAIRAFSRSIELKSEQADTHYNLGHALFQRSRYSEAADSYARAIGLNPTLDDAIAQLIHSRAILADWSHRETEESMLSRLGLKDEPVGPFSLLALDSNPERQLLRAERYAKSTFHGIEQRPKTAPKPGERPERLRVGYYSADFHNHATMFLMIRMFELHNRDRFDIRVFSYGNKQDDDMARRLKGAVDAYHDLRFMGDEAIAELSRTEKIDIAVDLKGYTQYSRSGIFAYRVAPIQVSYLGYPGTLGMEEMDYLIADETVVPASSSGTYSESVIHLPNSYQVNDNTREISDKSFLRKDFGLPEVGFVFSCFNNTYKIGPAEFDIWMRLLKGIEHSVLWLLGDNKSAEDNLRSEAQARGVDPGRIIISGKLPLPEHLARHQLADLFLDTFNVNAHTTASDALWAGLPLVTRMGESFASRVGGSLLHAVGLPELITETDADYEALALALARDPDRLAAIRAKLAENRLSAPLFDTARTTRDIERAYDQAYDRYLQGRPPQSFRVASGDSDP